MEFRANQTFLHGTQRYHRGEVYGEDASITRYFEEQGWVNLDLDQPLDDDEATIEEYEVEFKPTTLEVQSVKSKTRRGFKKGN